MRKLNITVMGKTYEVLVEDLGDVTSSNLKTPENPTYTAYAPEQKETAAVAAAQGAQEIQVTAPMGGTVAEVKTTVGATVRLGETLCTLNAMEIANEIPAPEDGTVKQIFVHPGDKVEAGTLLMTLR